MKFGGLPIHTNALHTKIRHAVSFLSQCLPCLSISPTVLATVKQQPKMATFASPLRNAMKLAIVLTAMMAVSPFLLLLVLPLAMLASCVVAMLGAMSLASGLAKLFEKVSNPYVQGFGWPQRLVGGLP